MKKTKLKSLDELLRSDIEQLYQTLDPSKKEYLLLQTIDNDEYKIYPGTKWEDVPPNWSCPDCQATKSDFEMIEL